MSVTKNVISKNSIYFILCWPSTAGRGVNKPSESLLEKTNFSFEFFFLNEVVKER